MPARDYLLLGLVILASSLGSDLVDNTAVNAMLDFVPLLAGFMAIGHAIERVCTREHPVS